MNIKFTGITKELLSHVMQNHADKAIEIIKEDSFDKSILDDLGISSVKMPLYYVSVCNNIMLSDENWVGQFKNIVLRNRAQCQKLLNFWKTEFNYDIEKGIDFSLFEEECSHFTDWDIEELLDAPLDKLVEKGYDRDEALLCYGVLTYKSKIIEEQISKHTNPDVYITGDLPPEGAKELKYDAYNALVQSNTIFADLFDCYCFGRFWESEEVLDVDYQSICELLEGAAYCQLSKRLKTLKDDFSY